MTNAESVRERIVRQLTIADRSLTPPLPPKISIEINNGCNHACYFCPNPIMTRPRRVMPASRLYRILDDARVSGVREVAFYATGEPFLVKGLPDYVRRAKEMDFSYVYLSTNGGRATSQRLMPVLECGLDSLKFSINAGTRETYAQVHGLDDFDEVLRNVARVSEYRRSASRPLKLIVSFVDTPLNRGEFEILRERLNGLVDEVILYPFMVIGTPLARRQDRHGVDRPFIGYEDTDRRQGWNIERLRLPCYQLWNYLNVTVEGYLSACCSDFNNDLIVGNLNRMSLLEAWHSEEFRALRGQHIAKQVRNTLCHSCIAQKPFEYAPLNPHLTGPDAPAGPDSLLSE